MMLRTLRAMTRLRGDAPKRITVEQWVNHDIRRSVRTHLSSVLRVPDEVREALLAHVRPGIRGVYDLHQYGDEKREALTLWAARLRGIVEPRPGECGADAAREDGIVSRVGKLNWQDTKKILLEDGTRKIDLQSIIKEAAEKMRREGRFAEPSQDQLQTRRLTIALMLGAFLKDKKPLISYVLSDDPRLPLTADQRAIADNILQGAYDTGKRGKPQDVELSRATKAAE